MTDPLTSDLRDPVTDREDLTVRWWRLLSGIAALNLALWLSSLYWISSRPEPTSHYTEWHVLLSGIYVAACAFRSFWPRIDLERYALVDHWISSMVLGRSAATIAEISFAVQMKLFIDELYQHAGGGSLAELSWLIVIALSVAQLFCWLSVINRSHLGHVIEESLWGISFTYIAVAVACALPETKGAWRQISWVALISSGAYVMYMFAVDVPMYLKRWRADTHQRQALSLDALRDAWGRRVVTRSWSIWRAEAVWLTGYFAGAVWLSMSLIFLPR